VVKTIVCSERPKATKIFRKSPIKIIQLLGPEKN
jgi:hypothetical protein